MAINWKDHFINLFVVILGISVAFYLESWRENQNVLQQEKAFLVELERSLEQDSILLDTLISINEFQQVTLTRLLRKESITSDSVGYFIYNIFYNLPFAPQKAVYESMKASGGIQSLKDFELAARIMELYEQDYMGMHQWNEAVDDHIKDFYRPYVIGTLQYTFGARIDGNRLQSREFRSIVQPYRAFHQGKSNYYLEVRERIVETKAMIRDYLR